MPLEPTRAEKSEAIKEWAARPNSRIGDTCYVRRSPAYVYITITPELLKEFEVACTVQILVPATQNEGAD